LPSPGSCTRCSRPLAAVPPGGLCAACATAETPARPSATRSYHAPDSHAPTATDLLGFGAGGPSASFRVAGDAAGGRTTVLPLPPSPPGYELLDALGGGGMGDVYLAREQASARLVAMKFLRFPGNADLLDRFTLELRVLAALDHPHIVRVFASDFLRADPFFTMEYLEPGTLTHALRDRGPFPPADAVRVARAVAGALAAAHAAGVIHRDLKPSNVLLARDGTPKVADFGLAKRLDEVDPITVQSGGLGTPSYMPPEQVAGRYGAVGPWSDVYGLGATLYHLLTGRPPFVGETFADILAQVPTAEPDRPRALRPEIPMGLEAVVLKCLEKNPARRYQSMAELVADVDRYEQNQRPAARARTRRERARRWAARNRVKLVVAAGTVLVAVGLVAAGWAFAPPPPPPKSADELKADRLEAIYADLLAGKSVTLVGDSGEPVWWESPTGRPFFAESPVRTKDDPGGCYFSTPRNQLTVLKLLDPPIDRYTVTLRFKHIGGPNTDVPVLGFFAALDVPKPDDGWREYSFFAVGYNDCDLARDLTAPPKPSAVTVGSRCYAALPGRLPNPAGCVALVRQTLHGVGKRLPGPWRTLVVQVTPERLVAFWDPLLDGDGNPGPTAKPLANLSVDDIRRHRRLHNIGLQNGKELVGHAFAPLPEWSPRLGIGVWAAEADIAVKNVVLSPSVTPNRSD
jgi:hypothetical protein